jgi:hypothetical protein
MRKNKWFVLVISSLTLILTTICDALGDTPPYIVYRRAEHPGEWQMSLTHRSLEGVAVKSRFVPIQAMKSYKVADA